MKKEKTFKKVKGVKKLEWALYAVIAMVLFSLANFVLKYLIKNYGLPSIDLNLIESAVLIAAVVVILSYFFLFTKKTILQNPAFLGLGLLLVTFSLAGFAFMLIALKEGKVALVSAILSISTITLALLSYLFMGDRFSWKEITAMALAVISILLLVF